MVNGAESRDLTVMLVGEHVDVDCAKNLYGVFVEEYRTELVVLTVGQRCWNRDVVGFDDILVMVSVDKLVDDFGGGAIARDETLDDAVEDESFGKVDGVANREV
ncbi:hypothetical protein SARC_06645 [Sphaeroforma arctica JP610]|uniref:Uncharacterized protein n=1 Tax=Sphaeroforma arctica JP610 TaxID=667725 RepID=A0A0L0FWJ7_9EUKA|nr:hypothetical protein SARC_06645 [Sphaeroforma arctica JP610]KNC81014.1 hypothetical protein SARC_06645 [Sphaeroforma arctica JP610]|eukprot:XP_014154916.1 hypothetical protein SARC_06645 [Sphaeroforma arctica JP610]